MAVTPEEVVEFIDSMEMNIWTAAFARAHDRVWHGMSMNVEISENGRDRFVQQADDAVRCYRLSVEKSVDRAEEL